MKYLYGIRFNDPYQNCVLHIDGNADISYKECFPFESEEEAREVIKVLEKDNYTIIKKKKNLIVVEETVQILNELYEEINTLKEQFPLISKFLKKDTSVFDDSIQIYEEANLYRMKTLQKMIEEVIMRLLEE